MELAHLEGAERILAKIFEYAGRIAKERDLDPILGHLTTLGRDILNADRCTIWLIDAKRGLLWTKVAQGIEPVTMPVGQGITGAAIRQRIPIVLDDAYSDPRFNRTTDRATGYRTESVLVAPLFNHDGEVIGAFQAINKWGGAKFDSQDLEKVELITLFSSRFLDLDTIRKRRQEDIEEQRKAHHKQKSIIVNDLEDDRDFGVTIHYQAADILSGDTYSLYRTVDGGILLYLIDGMGHGILPSLTSFAVASTVRRYAQDITSLKMLIPHLLATFQTLLDDEEQLSGIFIYIYPDLRRLEYLNGGMYPGLVETNKGVIHLSANNPPFMNFLSAIDVKQLFIDRIESLLLYSDGLVEEDMMFNSAHVEALLNPVRLRSMLAQCKTVSRNDDLTVLHMKRVKTQEE